MTDESGNDLQSCHCWPVNGFTVEGRYSITSGETQLEV